MVSGFNHFSVSVDITSIEDGVLQVPVDRDTVIEFLNNKKPIRLEVEIRSSIDNSYNYITAILNLQEVKTVNGLFLWAFLGEYTNLSLERNSLGILDLEGVTTLFVNIDVGDV